jgi:glucose/arabinose dehydrogenase
MAPSFSLTVRAARITALSFLSFVFVSTARSQIVPTNFVNDILVGALHQPTSFAFLPDGRVLLTEQRTGKVRLIVNNNHVAATDPVLTVPSLVSTGNEQGLLAIAIDPAWPTKPYVYLYYNRIGQRMRLVRYEASGDLNNAAGENMTLANPYLIIDDIPDFASNHNGGSLRFGPDGMLYLSMGEDADMCSAQDSTTLKGEVLRMTVKDLPPGAGGPAARATITPPDNPLNTTNANAKLVYAYGLRNPFRFHIDPVTGLLYVGDVGEITQEEYDEVTAGDNLGWPWREGTALRDVGACPEPGGVGAGAFQGPIATVSHGTEQAIIGGPIYHPVAGALNTWPQEYWGNAFFAGYYGGFIRRLKNTGTWAPAPIVPGQPDGANWATFLRSPTDFLVGPDGSLYWLSQFDATFSSPTGTLNRIRYTGPQVDVPPSTPASLSLSAAPTPFRGETELSFALASAGSVRLAMYDITGREVRVLLSGTAPAGVSRVRWDGADASGQPVPAGIYLARLDRLDGHEVARVLRLR